MTTYTLKEDGRFDNDSGNVRYRLMVDGRMLRYVNYVDGERYIREHMEPSDTYEGKFLKWGISLSYDEMVANWAEEDRYSIGE